MASPSRFTTPQGPKDFPEELVVLHPEKETARCRVLGTDREILLHTRGIPRLVPGEVLTLLPERQAGSSSHPYLSKPWEMRRVEVRSLGLKPLALEERGALDPEEELETSGGKAAMEEWLHPLVFRGKHPLFELEELGPGLDPEDPMWDPIIEAREMKEKGNLEKAEEVLFHLLSVDLRYLDAHAHLGAFYFEENPERALSHYAVGAEIGALSCPPGFDGYLPWDYLQNRPFLRCLHGLALCLWRTKRAGEAQAIFEWQLNLDPLDHMGIRFLLYYLRQGVDWEDLPPSL